MIVLAHRGWHGGSVHENTMVAFERAAAAGYGIETDLRTDASDRLVLFHDRLVSGMPVESLELEELRTLSGRAVPTLDELVALSPNVRINLEIKTRRAWRTLLSSSVRLPTGALVSSFVHEIAQEASESGFDAAFLIASAPLPSGRAAIIAGSVRTVVVDFNVADATLVEDLRAGGVATIAYGAVTADENRLVREWGCVATITDHPDLADDPPSSADVEDPTVARARHAWRADGTPRDA